MKNLKKVKKFHQGKKEIPKIVLRKTGSKEIVYGERALNARFPSYLDRPTTDYDIYSPTPLKDARQTERALDKHFGGDYFYVKPAQHKGTYKVVSKINEEGYADYTKPEGKIPSDVIRGKRYVKLSHVKKHIQKTLKDPEAKYRHAKDRDALNRILIYEKVKKGGKTVRKKLKANEWKYFIKGMRSLK